MTAPDPVSWISRLPVCVCQHSVTSHAFNTAGTARTRCDSADPVGCGCKLYELAGHIVWTSTRTWEAVESVD